MIPFLSLFNHSCSGMVTRIHYGTNVVVYAVQTIEAGEQASRQKKIITIIESGSAGND